MGLREWLNVKRKLKETEMANTAGNKVVINGRTVLNGDVVGGDLIINGTRNGVSINGQDFEISDKIIKITIEGNVSGKVETGSGDVTVQGNAGSVKTMSGDARIAGDVNGDVSTMSGDVLAKAIGGNVKTMSGDIRLK